MDSKALPTSAGSMQEAHNSTPDATPSRSLTRSEIEAQLRQRSEQMMARLDALQGEVTTIGDALKEAVVRSPFVAVGGAIAAGWLVGLMLGGRRRKRQWTGRKAHRALVEQYVEALVADVRHRVVRGAEAGEAVEKALKDRVPLIVVDSGERQGRRGLFGEFAIMALQTGLGFGMKAIADYLAAKLDTITVEEHVTVKEEPTGDTPGRVTTMTRTVSESAPE